MAVDLTNKNHHRLKCRVGSNVAQVELKEVAEVVIVEVVVVEVVDQTLIPVEEVEAISVRFQKFHLACYNFPRLYFNVFFRR